MEEDWLTVVLSHSLSRVTLRFLHSAFQFSTYVSGYLKLLSRSIRDLEANTTSSKKDSNSFGLDQKPAIANGTACTPVMQLCTSRWSCESIRSIRRWPDIAHYCRCLDNDALTVMLITHKRWLALDDNAPSLCFTSSTSSLNTNRISGGTIA